MSQFLVGLINNLPDEIEIRNTETSGNRASVPAGQVMVIQGGAGHWNIPDCSAEQYFAAHHMEIWDAQRGGLLYSFFDDDKEQYVIQYCRGLDYPNHQTMPGGNLPNGTDVVIQVDSTGLSCRGPAVVAGS